MNSPKLKLLAALVSSSLLLAGCGGSSSSADDPVADNGNPDTGTANPYSGSSFISGVIALSALNGSDANVVDGTTMQMSAASRNALATTGNAIVKLYVVGPDGELQDTGIDCSFDDQTDESGNPKYSCPDVADGKQYVIKYLRLLEGNKALEMKVNIEVPKGTPKVEDGVVSPESTVVVDTIINAILTATEGKDIAPEVVDDIIKSVKQAVVTLVRSGAVQVPSMVVEAPRDATGAYITDVARLKSEKSVNYGANEQLESAAGNLLSDETVASEVDAVKAEIKVRELEQIDSSSDAGKRKLIERVFKEMLGDGDVPAFIGDFFATRFIENRMMAIGTLFEGIKAGLKIDPRLAADLNALGTTKTGAMESFQSKLSDIYALMEKKASGTMTKEEKKALREIPSVIPALFPATEWKGKVITSTDELNVPQAIAFTIFVTDVYMADKLKQAGKDVDGLATTEVGEDGAVQVEMQDPVNFDPMHFDPAYANGQGGQPGLMQLYGFFEPQNLDALDGVEISWLDIMPDKAWISGPDGMGGSEVDMLRANVCVSDLSKLAQLARQDGAQGGDGGSDLTVELSYPTSNGGRASVALLSEELLRMPPPGGDMGPQNADGPDGGPEGDRGPGFESCFVLDPWAKAQHEQGGNGGPVNLAETDVISDFVSGSYRVDVKQAGAVIASREFNRKVLVGMSDVRPHLTAPNGMPAWPKSCEGKAGPCAEWDALQEQWLADGGNTTFALNEDSDGDGIKDKAKVTLSWEKPRVELPDGVKIAYSLNVGLNRGCDDNGCDWQPIYDTWQQDRKLFGTSFTLPVLLERMEVGQGSYNVNVCALFIDTDNGREIGRGSCGWAEFYVGEALDMNATFTIEGTAPDSSDTRWKVALMKESFNPDLLVDQWQRTVVEVAGVTAGSYSLTPTIGDYLNADPSAHYQIVLFRDDDGDGEPGVSEPVLWPDGEDNARFETWGGVLRYVRDQRSDGGDFERHEEVVTGGETLTGPAFTFAPEGPGLGDGTPGTPDSSGGNGNGGGNSGGFPGTGAGGAG